MLTLHAVDASLLALLGLLVGSFLNVVIYRLPVMLDAQWHAECAELHGQELPETARFNLLTPRSRCQACGHQIAWQHNIPVLSYLALRGQCGHCQSAISPRYPLVELATGALFFYCGWHWGANEVGLLWCGFAATLVALAMIDWDTTLLPDCLTLPMLWAGLIGTALHLTGIALPQALWGAVAGYLSLWLVYWAFKLATGKEGMGYGDFKLLGAIGAWFGWQMLPLAILASSAVGALIGIALILFKNHGRDTPIPFGPYLAGAGIITLFWGRTITHAYIGNF